MSEIPSLEQMLKLWSKKDLWNRIQEKNQRIAELEEQLKNALEQNNKHLQQIMDLQSKLIVERLKGV